MIDGLRSQRGAHTHFEGGDGLVEWEGLHSTASLIHPPHTLPEGVGPCRSRPFPPRAPRGAPRAPMRSPRGRCKGCRHGVGVGGGSRPRRAKPCMLNLTPQFMQRVRSLVGEVWHQHQGVLPTPPHHRTTTALQDFCPHVGVGTRGFAHTHSGWGRPGGHAAPSTWGGGRGRRAARSCCCAHPLWLHAACARSSA